MLDGFFIGYTTPILVSGVCLLALWYSTRRPSGLPPGPRGVPVLGNLVSMKPDFREQFQEWRKQYGDLFTLYLGNRLTIVLNGYDTVKEALVKNSDVFAVRPYAVVFNDLFQNKGVISSNGEVWKEQRRLTLSTLRDFGMGKNILQEKINEEVQVCLEVIADQKGHKYDTDPIIQTSVSNIICSMVFGRRFQHDDPLFIEYLKKTDENFKAAGKLGGLNFIPFAKHLPGDLFLYHRTVKNIAFYEDRLIKPSIEEHLKAFDENNIDDFIAAYIREMKVKEKQGVETSIGFDNLVKVVGDLFIAGTDTTSTTIQWILLYLTMHQDIQAKCFREIEDNIGTEKRPEMTDKLKLPFIEATITEVQRIANISPIAGFHGVTEDIVLKGYHLPAGCIIFPNLDSIMMDPEIWENPGQFRPERFLSAEGKFVKPEEFIPFSLGKRACPGESLARMELFLFITGLVQRFHFLPPEDEPPLSKEPLPGAVLKPQPFKVMSVPRQ
ncbi:cytochrome P450 2H2-like [Haliotis rubra]|uniref:cytochrome P450 2H2-like n=1 Tax=Haliotis rubra TaxID=36100 RepID=UPI001EE5AD38|nr:cytochrome P450 2H2-like [Haliotis rubra]